MAILREGSTVSEAIKALRIWKLVIFKMVVGFLIVTGLPLLSSNFDWHTSTTWLKIQFIIGLLLAGLKHLDGFLDTTIQNVKSKGNPLGLDLPPEQVTTVQTTTSTTVKTDDKTNPTTP